MNWMDTRSKLARGGSYSAAAGEAIRAERGIGDAVGVIESIRDRYQAV